MLLAPAIPKDCVDAGLVISPVSVHADPFQDSVSLASLLGDVPTPATIKPAVVLPTPLPLLLPVFKSVISVQDVPLYCSTIA